MRVFHGDRTDLIPDPGNPEIATNPFGFNSVVTGAGYEPPAWLGSSSPAGSLSEIRVSSKAYRVRRAHYLYRPPGIPDSRPLPLLAVHDGTDYVNHAALAHALDSLIHHEVVRPFRAVLLNPKARHDEYVGSALHAAHLVEEVIPYLTRRVRTIEPLGVMGASLGAVAALHAAHTYPGTFGRLFLQSGTFAFSSHVELSPEMYGSIRSACDPVTRRARLDGARVYLTCGRFESLIDWNRKLAASLADQLVDVVFVESWAGHDWGAWRDHFENGLRFLFPARDHDIV